MTYQWNGTIWLAVGSMSTLYVGDTPPASPGPNQLWWNSALGTMFIWYNDGNTTQWVPTEPNLGVAPPTPVAVWRQIGRIVPVASQPTVDFTNIPADINDLWATFDVTPTVNGAGFVAQFFDGAGAIINAGYNFANTISYHSQNATAPVVAGSNAIPYTSGFILTYGIAPWNAGTATGLRGRLTVPNIRDVARYKGADWQTNFLTSDGSYNGYDVGSGFRSANGNITGLRFVWGSGGFAAGGAVNLWGSP